MISDEQIRQIFVAHGFKLNNETGDDLKPYVYDAARALIKAAQQVKELEFVEVDSFTHYAKAFPFGGYSVKNCGNDIWYVQMTFRQYFIDVCIDKAMTQDQAISAANADYKHRVLSCLVWGGV